jgi:hypothetical protein
MMLFVCGMVIGGIMGVLVSALCNMAGREDDE